MYEDWEVIDTLEVDGFDVEIAAATDIGYVIGEDDDGQPDYSWQSFGNAPADPELEPDEYRDPYDGTFLPRPVVASGRDGVAVVYPDDLAKFSQRSGLAPAAARKAAQHFVDGIAGEHYHAWIVRTTATRNGHTAAEYLGGIETDDRDRGGNGWSDIVDAGGELIGEAIAEWGREMLGRNMAILAGVA